VDVQHFWYKAYIVTYSPAVQPYWLYSIIAAGGCWFIFGPIYSSWVTNYYQKNEIEEIEGVEPDDEIKENENFSCKTMRILLGYFAFAIVLAGSTIITYIVCREQLQLQLNSLITSAIVSVVLELFNMLWNKVGMILTKFEKHRTWTSFRVHSTMKYYLFKMLNTIAMYISRYILLAEQHDGCNIASIILNILALVLTAVMRAIGRRKGRKSAASNEEAKPEFDVAEEYLQLLYRQFVVYLGMPIFPFLPLLGFLSHLVDYKTDKYRLLRMCQQTYHLRGSMRKFLTFYLFVTAGIAAISFPYGAAWILSSYNFSKCQIK